jgi:hypothetical protein
VLKDIDGWCMPDRIEEIPRVCNRRAQHRDFGRCTASRVVLRKDDLGLLLVIANVANNDDQ